MAKWVKRVRAALGMGVTWAIAWGGAGAIVMLGFLLRTGSRPDAPFPLLFSAAGFIAGLLFCGVLSVVEGRRRFDEMSLRRFATWGAAGGFALATAFVLAVSLSGDPAFLWNLAVVGPVFAAAAAGAAAGSLALARKAQDRAMLQPADDLTALPIPRSVSRAAERWPREGEANETGEARESHACATPAVNL